MKRKLSFLYASLLCCAVLIATPAWAQIIYSNGPINGTIGNHDITAGNDTVTNSFLVSGPPFQMTYLTFGAWLNPGDVLQNVGINIWTQPTGGQLIFSADLGAFQYQCSTNSQNFSVCTEEVHVFQGQGPTFSANTTYWLSLSLANSQKGGPVGWDINNGVGCTSPGCPSQAQDEFGNSIQSESFAILGGLVQLPTPEPGSLALLATGIVAMAGAVRRKIMR